MIQEVQDQYELLVKLHGTVDKMLEGLSDEAWSTKPLENMNSVASVMDHVLLVEKKFLGFLTGQKLDIDTQAPFKTDQWNVVAIREEWAKSLDAAQTALERVKEEDLTQEGAALGVGTLNKRQLLSYMIAHTAHHRGQIPIIKKLLVSK